MWPSSSSKVSGAFYGDPEGLARFVARISFFSSSVMSWCRDTALFAARLTSTRALLQILCCGRRAESQLAVDIDGSRGGLGDLPDFHEIEVAVDGVCVWIAVARNLGHHLPQHVAKAFGEFRPERARIFDGLIEMHRHHHRAGAAAKRRPAGHQVIQRRAERIDIRAPVDVPGR